ncbi:MAG: hypothetical protein AAF799_29310 [Myxococcota bacterium]
MLSACVATEPEPLGDVGDTGDDQGQTSTTDSADSAAPTGDAGDDGATQGATSTTDATGTTNATTPGTDDGAETDGGDTEGDMSTGDEPGTSGGVADCGGLDEAACAADPACMELRGQEIVQAGAVGLCLGPPQFLYCIDAGVGCLPATATVCNGGSFYEAWSQCPLPAEWMACDPPGMVNGDC